jgi:hypothetical protein
MQNRLIFMALCLSLLWAVGFPLYATNNLADIGGYDYDVYIQAAKGDLTGYFYPQWLLPFFSLLSYLPRGIGWAVLNLMNLAGCYFAVRAFEGNLVLTVISYPLFFVYFYGNVEGILVGAAAMMVWSLRQRRDVLAAIAWIILLTKPQIGMALGLVFFGLEADRRQFIKVAAIVVAWGILSLLIWWGWIFDWYDRVTSAEELYDVYSIDLWQFVGPLALLLCLPPIYFRSKDLPWLVATFILTMPYLQSSGLLYLIIQPIGAVGWLVQISYILGPRYAAVFWIVPVIVYGRSLINAGWKRPIRAAKLTK